MVLAIASGKAALGRATAAAAAGYHADTQTIIDAMTTAGSTPDSTRQGRMDTFVRSMKLGATSGTDIWAAAAVIDCFAVADETQAGINWRQPGTYNPTKVGTPTLTANQGIAGGTSGQYWNLQYNPSTASLSTSDAAIFYYSRTNAIDTTYQDIGQMSGTTVLVLNARSNASGDSPRFRFPNTASANIGSRTDSRGGFLYNRTSSTSIQLYVNGAASGSAVTDTVTTYANSSLSVLENVAGAPAPSIRQISWVMIFSRALTANEALDAYNAVQTYMTAYGTNV